MKILFYDRVQDSDADEKLKSAALSDKYIALTAFVITLDDTYDIDCVGIGYTDATTLIVNGESITITATTPDSFKNGLYALVTPLLTDTLTISHNGTYIGRFAAGKYVSLSASPTREPGYYTTSAPRVTAAGQVVIGAGGVAGRKISLDFRYKFNETIIKEIEQAYFNQISKGFPLFILFDNEDKKIHWLRLYASCGNEIVFQSSVAYYLYSKRFDFVERF